VVHHIADMVKERMDVETAVDHHFVFMVKERHNAKIAVDHHFVGMVKERMDVETAVDLLLVLIPLANTNARSVPLLVLVIMFNVASIAFCWTQTLEDLEIIDPSIS
jgi:hypothetical protein